MPEIFNQIKQRAGEIAEAGVQLASELALAAEDLKRAKILEAVANEPCECAPGEDQSHQLKADAQALRAQVEGRLRQKFQSALAPKDSNSKTTNSSLLPPPVPVLETQASTWSKGFQLFHEFIDPNFAFLPQDNFGSSNKEVGSKIPNPTSKLTTSPVADSARPVSSSPEPSTNSGVSTTSKVLIGVGALGVGIALGVTLGKAALLRYAATRVGAAGLGGAGTALAKWLGGGALASSAGGGLVFAGEGAATLTAYIAPGALMLATAAGGAGLGALVLVTAAGSNLPAIPDDIETSETEGPEENTDTEGNDCAEWVGEFLQQELGISAEDLVLAPYLEMYVRQLCEHEPEQIRIWLAQAKRGLDFWCQCSKRFIYPGKSFEQIRLELLKNIHDAVKPQSVEIFFKAIQHNEGIWRGIVENYDRANESPAVRFGLLNPHHATYLLGWRELLNPRQSNLSVFYGGMGADISTPLLATNATKIEGVDLHSVNIDQLEYHLNEDWSKVEIIDWDKLKGRSDDKAFILEIAGYMFEGNRPPKNQVILRMRNQQMFWAEEIMNLIGIERAIAIELKALGVNPKTIRVREVQDPRDGHPVFKIEFDWRHPSESSVKRRSLEFHAKTDLINFIQRKAQERQFEIYDVYYQKSIPAAHRVDYFFPIAVQASSILVRPGGHVLLGSISGSTQQRETTRGQVNHLLQSEGFSFSNPSPLYQSLVAANLAPGLYGPLEEHSEYGWRMQGGTKL